jgi:hypothetical protein
MNMKFKNRIFSLLLLIGFIIIPLMQNIDNSTANLPNDDFLEENDISGSASTVDIGQIDNLIQNDDDWYKIYVAPSQVGYNLTVKIDFIHNWNNMDLYIYDAALTLLDSGTTNYSPESVRVAPLSAGWYYFKVVGYNNHIEYDMDIALSHDWIGDDWGEPNDYWKNPTTLKTNNINYTYTSMKSYDSDFFKLKVAQGDFVRVSVFNQTLNSLLTLSFSYANNNSLITNTWWWQSSTEIRLTLTAASTTSIIINITGAFGVLYNVYFEHTLADDFYEDNDNHSNAALLEHSDKNYADLILKDSDWFNIPIQAGETLKINLTYNSIYASSINLRLCDGSGTTIKLSTQASASEENITIFAPHFANYSLCIDGSSAGYLYNLLIRIDGATDDIYDQDGGNDGPNGAVNITNLLTLNDLFLYKATTAEEDWYSIYLKLGDTIKIDIEFLTTDSDIDVEFLDDDGYALLNKSSGTTGQKSISFQVNQTDSYYVVIKHGALGYFHVFYNMSITVTPGTLPTGTTVTNSNTTSGTNTNSTSGTNTGGENAPTDDFFGVPGYNVGILFSLMLISSVSIILIIKQRVKL